MNRFFRMDGSLMVFMNKFGQLVMLTAVWLVCCIPILTIGTATSALYYAAVKSVRRDRGYCIREFFSAFKRNLKKGTFITLGLVLWGFILYLDREYSGHEGNVNGYWMVVIYDILLVVTAIGILFLFPILSRFTMKTKEMLRFSLILGFKHLPITIILAAGLIATIFLVFVLPLPMCLILPGGWCYLSSILIEKVLMKYTPKPEEGEDAWYYE